MRKFHPKTVLVFLLAFAGFWSVDRALAVKNFEVKAASSYLFVEGTSGNAGIGSTVPQAKFEVDGNIYVNNANIGISTTAPRAFLEVGNALHVITSGASPVAVLNGDLLVDGKVYGDGSQLTGVVPSQWTTSGSNIYNNNAGNVGISTTAPVASLEVDGNIYVKNANIGISTTIPRAFLEVGNGLHGIWPGSSPAALMNGNLMVDGNVYINGDASASPHRLALTGGDIIATGDGRGNTYNFPLPFSGSAVTLVGQAETQTLYNKTWNSNTIGITYGGTGATTLTGVLKGNGTSALTGITTGTASAVTRWTDANTIGTGGILTDDGTNVGVNSTGPQARLDVEGNVYFGNGNVGIGSTGPLAKLEVDGNIYVKQANVGISSTAPRAFLEVGKGSHTLTSGASPLAVINGNLFVDGKIYGNGANLTAVLPWTTSGTVIYYNTGNVGINSTAPQAKLDMGGNVYVGTGNLGIASTGPQAKLEVDGNIYVKSSNVGIGTTIPRAFLEVGTGLHTLTAGAFPLAVMNGNLMVDGKVYGSGASLTGLTATQWTTSGTAIYYTTGNVGIGSSVPQAKLEVDGNIYVQNANIGISTTVTRASLDVGNGATITSGSSPGAAVKGNLMVDGYIYVTGSANPVLTQAGQMSVDTSSGAGGMFRVYTDASRAIPTYFSYSFFIGTPTASSDYSLWKVPYAITVRAVHLQCTGTAGSYVVGGIDDGSSGGGAFLHTLCSDITGNVGLSTDGTITNSGSVGDGEYVLWHTTSIGATPSSLTVTFDYTIDLQ